MQLIIAEKPSVARDLARVLGVPARGKTHFEGSGRVITWCVGHLVELEEPAAYDPRWKYWRLDTLPMIPERFKLRPAPSTPEQFRAVRSLLRDERFEEVVNACDAGREGELIFRYVYQLAGARLPVRRLWISSLTDEAIRRGFATLRPGADFDRLADAARCRSEADWLVGINATRALTARSRSGAIATEARSVAEGTLYSIGRVQTPTLAMIVARERAIRAFVPRDYWEVRATFATAASERFEAIFTHAGRTRLSTALLANEVLARVRAHAAPSDTAGPRVESVRTRRVKEAPPLLFDLTSLQRAANRRYGLSAQRTLDIAQALYETHKVLTYPRTDARHLSADIAKELPRLFGALRAAPEYAPFAEHLLAHPPPVTKRVFDDAKVSDHHAIIPTGKPLNLDALEHDERRVFDLVARRFLGAFYPDAEFDLSEVSVLVGPGNAAPLARNDTRATSGPEAESEGPEIPLDVLPPPPDRFIARGRVRLVAGWQQVAGIDTGDEKSTEGSTASLPRLVEGERLVGEFASLAKKTQPPHRYTEATLLSAMESAGRSIEDDVIRQAMRDCGLGTPATRAAIIETLLKRGFITRDRKHLLPTSTGEALIDALPVESLRSPELTGAWEARLARIARGEDSRTSFMADIAAYVRSVVDAVRAAPPPAAAPRAPAGAGPVGRCPRCGGEVVELSRAFACATGAKPCGLSIPKVIAGRAVSANLARTLLAQGRTRTLAGFRSREGRRFSAALMLDDNGTVRFDVGRKNSDDVATLTCPACKSAPLMTGQRGWGCSRWREGCGFVVWFEAAGKRITIAQLRELIERGRTRKGKWTPGKGPPVSGRLVLDPNARGGAVRFEPAA